MAYDQNLADAEKRIATLEAALAKREAAVDAARKTKTAADSYQDRPLDNTDDPESWRRLAVLLGHVDGLGAALSELDKEGKEG